MVAKLFTSVFARWIEQMLVASHSVFLYPEIDFSDQQISDTEGHEIEYKV